MMVECIGLPGVGKTTMLRSQTESLAEVFKIVDSRISHKWNSLLSVVLYYMWMRWILNDRILARKLAYRMSFRLINIFSGQPVLFFDSGLAQVILENLIESNFMDQDQKINLLKKLHPRIDVMIYIHDVFDDILERESGRSVPRFSLGREDLRNRYGKALDLLENRLLPCAQRVYKVKSNTLIDTQDILSG